MDSEDEELEVDPGAPWEHGKGMDDPDLAPQLAEWPDMEPWSRSWAGRPWDSITPEEREANTFWGRIEEERRQKDQQKDLASLGDGPKIRNGVLRGKQRWACGV